MQVNIPAENIWDQKDSRFQFQVMILFYFILLCISSLYVQSDVLGMALKSKYKAHGCLTYTLHVYSLNIILCTIFVVPDMGLDSTMRLSGEFSICTVTCSMF